MKQETKIFNYKLGEHPDLPPPINVTGPIAWIRKNLLSSPLNIFLTLFSVSILWLIIPPLVDWFIIEAVWTAKDKNECWDKMTSPKEGACWAFIKGSLSFFFLWMVPGRRTMES